MLHIKMSIPIQCKHWQVNDGRFQRDKIKSNVTLSGSCAENGKIFVVPGINHCQINTIIQEAILRRD